MAQNDNILQELRELGSTVLTASISTLYEVPRGYFESLSDKVLARVKTLEATTVREELSQMSELLGSFPRLTPYQVPAGYFHGLEERLLQGALDSENNLSAQEELEHLSPLLSSLKKELPYSVPDDYFTKLDMDRRQQPSSGAKIISINSRQWIRFAAAAVVVAFVAVAGLIYFKKDKLDPSDKSYAWVKKNMNKVSTDDLEEFIDLAQEEAPVVASTDTQSEIKELMKNIPDQAIQDFLADAQDAEPDSNDDILLN